MTTEQTNGDVIRYTTKELLSEIRDGISAIKTVQSAHETRLLTLEKTVQEHEKLAEVYPERIDNLVKSINIQDAVNAALEARRDRGFTKTEKIIGIVTGLALLVLNVLSLGPDIISGWGG